MRKEGLIFRSNKKNINDIIQSICCILLLIVIDQISKYTVLLQLKGKKAVVVFKDVFELNYLENRSAAFGIDPITILNRIFKFKYFTNHPNAFTTAKFVFFVVFTIVVVSVMLYIVYRIPIIDYKYVWLKFSLLLIVSGAVGNFIDRVCRKYVIDFFYFKLINFPIFNVADIYITIGAIMMCCIIVFLFNEDDLGTLMSNIKNK
ncbi:signal peptidase II [Lachnobacterium bovis]|uniref:Lipoprotein signal peptidase n=1 Tax=Lachnobacterium bovis DSM 14045 TaxID=1122142 RepID=A0A1H3F6C7_9FIRM|nr:signal peptidase II [Lachnobacterium bovis]SDX86387.1 signal peptidase II [Lachnobacterium bovis DSM 14045]